MVAKKVAAKDRIDELNDYGHARLRTEMYFGGRVPVDETILCFDEKGALFRRCRFVPALVTYFREVLDNSLDELIGHRSGSRIDITYDPDTMVFTVADDGGGIPLDKVEAALSKARAGRNFRNREEVAGTNGVGAAAVNFTSEWFEVTVRRDGKKRVQRFTEAGPLDGEELQIGRPKFKDSTGHGTEIRFKPSKSVFPDMTLPLEFVRARVYEVAAINPSIRFTFNGERLFFGRDIRKTLFAGLDPIVIDVDETVEVKLAAQLDDSGKMVQGETKMVPFKSTFYLVPQFSGVEPGLRINDAIEHSLVNNICAYNGGTHMTAFKSVFYNGLLDALKSESRRRKLAPNKSDVADGLLIFNVTRMTAPNFDSQSKTRLTNAEADRAVRKHLEGEVAFRKIIRDHPEWIEAIYARCAARTQKQDMSEADKEQNRLHRQRIAKLTPAVSPDRSKCVLFIGEGDSALGKLEDERDPEYHAILPLRGKILNVNGVPVKSIVVTDKGKPTTLGEILAVIGLKIGQRAIRSTLNYGKCYIATDEDEDGKNITALLVNFFYTFWPELFDRSNPFFYRFNTPFIILKKGKDQREYFFGYNYADFKPTDWKGWEVTRAKGLGTLDGLDWVNMLKSPKLTALTGDDRMKEALDLIFNELRADDRKKWIGA